MGLTGKKINSKMTSEDFCLADNVTTYTILKDKKYFQSLKLCKANVNTISGSSNLIEGSGKAIIMLPKGTKLCIDDYIKLKAEADQTFQKARFAFFSIPKDPESEFIQMILSY